MSHHEAIDALPTVGNKDPQILRNFLIKRVTYNFADADDPTAWDALDGVTGAIPLAVAFQGVHFFLDPDDTTSVHDGTTVVVTNDGYRYKADGTDYVVKSVLDKDLTAPPGAPTLGDAYIVAAAATGAWAGHDDEIGIYTARGWRFATARIGQLVLIEDEATFYHWSVGGTWTAGLGNYEPPAGSVTSTSLLGGRTHWVVENQTTNTPPASPGDGVAYIVGGSPTGAWAGSAAKIAVAKDGAWTIYTPGEGWTAYDRALNLTYVYTGTAWAALSQGYSRVGEALDTASAGLSRSNGSSNGYNYSATTAPTSTGQSIWIETLTLAVQADFSGQVLDVDYECTLDPGAITGVGSASGASLTVACFIDSETNARDWQLIAAFPGDGAWVNTAATWSIRNACRFVNVRFKVTLADTSAHTLKIIFCPYSGGVSFSGGTFTVSRRSILAIYRSS